MDAQLPIIAAIAGAIGAIVAAGISVLNSLLIRRSEERRQIRELAVRVAIEEWKFDSEEVARRNQAGTYINPLDLYLVHAMYFVRMLGNKTICEDQLRSHLKEAHAMTKVADKVIEKFYK